MELSINQLISDYLVPRVTEEGIYTSYIAADSILIMFNDNDCDSDNDDNYIMASHFDHYFEDGESSFIVTPNNEDDATTMDFDSIIDVKIYVELDSD